MVVHVCFSSCMGTALAHPKRRAVGLAEEPTDLDSVYGRKAVRPGGGEYRAVQNPDGTWNILDIPFFGSHILRDEEGGHEIDAAWQRESVKHHGEMWADGFLNPLIINHHDDLGMTDVYAGGHFLPTRVAKARLYDKQRGETREVDATFVDLMYLPEHVYADFRRGGLPYLSTEFRFEDHEHVHLAALNTESPWFKFPLITIGDEVPHDGADEEEEMPTVSLRAKRHAHKRALALRSATAKTATAIVPLDSAKREALRTDIAKLTDALDSLAKRQDDEQGGDMNGDGAQTGLDTDGDGQTTLKDIFELMKRVLKTMGEMVGAGNGDDGNGQQQQGQQQMQPAGVPAEQTPPAARGDDDAAKAGGDTGKGDDDTNKRADGGAKPEHTMQTKTQTAQPDSALAKRVAEMQGELAATKASVAKHEAEKARETAIRSAMGELEPLQIPNLRSDLEGVYDDKDAGGQVALNAYVTACKRHARPAPPENWTGELAPSSDDPPEVAAYIEHGPDVLRRARDQAKLHRQARAGGMTTADLKTWLKANMPGVKPRQAKDED